MKPDVKLWISMVWLSLKVTLILILLDGANKVLVLYQKF